MKGYFIFVLFQVVNRIQLGKKKYLPSAPCSSLLPGDWMTFLPTQKKEEKKKNSRSSSSVSETLILLSRCSLHLFLLNLLFKSPALWLT